MVLAVDLIGKRYFFATGSTRCPDRQVSNRWSSIGIGDLYFTDV